MDCAVRDHAVELQTLDGHLYPFRCAGPAPGPQAGMTLLDAAEAAGLRLVAQCRQGSCGACRAQVLNGAYVLGEHNPAMLPQDRSHGGPQAGAVLLCRTTPQGDMRLALPYGHERIGTGLLPSHQAEVLTLERDGDHTFRLVLQLQADEPGGTAVAEFEPGQFMELVVPAKPGLPEGLRRAYSLANTPNWDGRLEFYIRRQPQGRFSHWLQEQAQVGQRLTVHGPQGAFGLKENGLRPRWFVAGGTGLAPLLSMLRRMAEWSEPHPARLYLGVTREAELFADDALADLQASLPALQLARCVWQPSPAWAGPAGSAVAALQQDLAMLHAAAQAAGRAVDWPDLYVCGPTGMVAATEAACLALGVPADRLNIERFGA